MITDSQLTFWQHFSQWGYRFWKFSRPHTIIGTSLSVLALYSLVVFSQADLALNLWPLAGALLACLSGNIYIVGLNQLEDIEIDKINKPHLPLAAGEFSLKQGQYLVGIAGILAILVAGIWGEWLLLTVAISLLIGTAYSLPPLRLKRFPFWAAISIFTVRGFVVNLGIFLHFSQVLTGELLLTPSLYILTLFIVIFTIAIAVFKDVPDLEGDRQYQIKTFSLLLGKSAIFKLSLVIITVCYVLMIIAGILNLPGLNSWLLIFSHTVLLGLFWWRSNQVNLKEKNSITSFYQFIWKLFFLEYLLFPLACFPMNS